ncbi:putative peptidase [Hibiscus syriacus]|uniref:Peptidase n=1 Tax=Hibiscus syriacus TaxID=106335 RepID=A0A6A3C144_HIBSY|nr:putative peptidase [Hibiscus syriacus]
MGSGFVNATLALDPGLIFDTTYEEYMSFLCGINGSSPAVLNYTGQNCQRYNSTIAAVDLNLPSVTIAKLNQSKTVERSVTNIARNETYKVSWTTPSGISMKVIPTCFFISTGGNKS